MMAGSDLNVSEVINTVMKIVVDKSDLGLQSIGAWLLGHLYLSACAVAENRSAGKSCCLARFPGCSITNCCVFSMSDHCVSVSLSLPIGCIVLKVFFIAFLCPDKDVSFKRNYLGLYSTEEIIIIKQHWL